MRKKIAAILTLFVLSVTMIVSAENGMATIYTVEPSRAYVFTGYFERVKGTRHNVDAIVLARNNTDRGIFVYIDSKLIGDSPSQSMKECIGDLSSPYGGQVKIVSSISRINSYWITLRLQDATCQRLPR